MLYIYRLCMYGVYVYKLTSIEVYCCRFALLCAQLRMPESCFITTCTSWLRAVEWKQGVCSTPCRWWRPGSDVVLGLNEPSVAVETRVQSFPIIPGDGVYCTSPPALRSIAAPWLLSQQRCCVDRCSLAVTCLAPTTGVLHPAILCLHGSLAKLVEYCRDLLL
jgi:hypothetical protein